jgi:hypothetical protein
MDRAYFLDCFDVPAGVAKDPGEEVRIENMVVQATVDRIRQRARAELLWTPGIRIESEVVEFQDLGHMGLIGFGRAKPEVFLQMGQRGDRTTVIEGSFGVRNNEDQRGARAGDSPPLPERPKGVGRMFEAMRREHGFISFVGEPVQIRRFSDPLPTGLLLAMKTVGATVLESMLPGGLCGEIHVVDLVGPTVNRQRSARSEEPAGATDLERTPPHGCGAHLSPTNRPDRPNPVANRDPEPGGPSMPEAKTQAPEYGDSTHG